MAGAGLGVLAFGVLVRFPDRVVTLASRLALQLWPGAHDAVVRQTQVVAHGVAALRDRRKAAMVALQSVVIWLADGLMFALGIAAAVMFVPSMLMTTQIPPDSVRATACCAWSTACGR